MASGGAFDTARLGRSREAGQAYATALSAVTPADDNFRTLIVNGASQFAAAGDMEGCRAVVAHFARLKKRRSAARRRGCV